jgi:hypothetical protein
VWLCCSIHLGELERYHALAVMTSLDAWDIAALRFGVADPLLSPVLVRRGLARDRLGWLGLA